MIFSEIILRRKTFLSMLFVGLSLLGYISYKQLPMELLPSTELPFLVVQVNSIRDLDPEYVEKQAIIQIEGAIGTLEDIEKIESYVQRRRATVFVYYTQAANLKYAYLKLQQKIDAVKPALADDFIVNVFKIDTEQLSNMFMNLQIRGGGDVDRIRQVVDRYVVNDLENIDGIANVDVFGGREKSVEIILDEDACRAHNITANTIRGVLARNSRQGEFLGHVFQNDKQYFVNLQADYVDVKDLEQLILNPQGPVLLRDVADVYVGVKEMTSISRVNGKEAVTVQLIRDSQANLIDLSHRTRDVIAGLNESLKHQDVEIVVQTDSAEEMERNIDLIMQLALVGGLLAVVILWFFLHNLRLVIVIALAIPISLLVAMNFFYAFGITINSLTLVGAALAIGMLLDNSIVVLENIYRLRSRGTKPDEAVIGATREVWRSIFAATMTTIAIFIPFVFASNLFVRILGKQIGVSIISTLLVSLVVALLLIPAAAHKFLVSRRKLTQIDFNQVSQKNRLMQIYTLLLKSTMRFPVRTIMVAILLFFISLLMCLKISLDVSEEVETPTFTLYVTMPSGSTLDGTDVVVAGLEEKLKDLKEYDTVTSQIYEQDASLSIKLKENFEKIAGRTIAEIKEDIWQRVKNTSNAEVSFEQPTSSQRFRGGAGRNPGRQFMNMLGIGTQEEKVVIRGDNFALMKAIGEDIRYMLDEMDAIRRVRMSIADDRPEVHLLFDNQTLSHYNIPLASIASELSGFENEFSSGMKYKQGTDEYDIIIRGDVPEDEDEKRMDDLTQLLVPSASGGVYAMDQISRIVYASGLSSINRVNQEKQIELTYQFEDEINSSKNLLEAARTEIDQLVEGIDIPTGIVAEVIHEERDFSEFYFLFGAAFLLIYMILASVFESVLLPVVMMFSIPLAVVGSLWAIIVTGNSIMNANTLIGFLILLGVVVNNGIILIDYANLLRDRGYSLARALLTAGQARVRPILITTITTIVAMFPLAMGKAEYVIEIGAPFAITVIGGLAVGMLFTLVFIPTMYIGLETATLWIRRLPGRVNLIQLAIFITGTFYIYDRVDSVIWRYIWWIGLIMLIPGITYFIRTSLRKARADFFRNDEPLTIRLQHIVKIYDDHSRFVREWLKHERQQERDSSNGKATSVGRSLAWQVPLFVFLVYFVYFYLERGLWVFVSTHFVYLFGFQLLFPLMDGLNKPRISKWLYRVYYWAVPLTTLLFFYFRFKNIAALVFAAILWGILLLIYASAQKIHREKLNIARVTGRFSALRRLYYRTVIRIPILGRRRNAFRALNGVSLEISSGMFGLLGPNGAGKTTMMRIICGILEQTRGSIRINDVDLREHREELQGLIGYLPQEFGTYENMTAYEFLDYQAMMRNILDPEKRKATVDRVLKAVHLEESQDRKIGTFSGGMKQRVGIAQTLLHLPRILVVDEPTAGLDPRERIRFRNLLVELSKERIVIFSTHIIEDISSSCNRVAVLNKGDVCYLGEPLSMTRTVEGHVWQLMIPPDKFEQQRLSLWVVHHMPVGDKIRARLLAESQPDSDAIQVTPTLEDAYLWLLGRDRRNLAPQTSQ